MYAKIKDDAVVKFPYGVNELKIDNPYTNYGPSVDPLFVFSTTESAVLHGFSLVEVVVDEEPTFDFKTQRIEQANFPILTNGIWKLEYTVVNLTDEEQAALREKQAAAVRLKRNELLKESDWTQGKDISESISTPWAEYRNQLRNITQQENFPWEIEWPSSTRSALLATAEIFYNN